MISGGRHMASDYTIMVGGEAGQGVQTIGLVLVKTFARSGWHVFADQDYESRIRGGHNFFRIRISDTEVQAISEPVHILLALNGETVDLHQEELAEDGVILVDSEEANPRPSLYKIPFERLAHEHAGNKKVQSAVALGSALACTRCNLATLEQVIQEQFSSGGSILIEENIKAVRAGYAHTRELLKGYTPLTCNAISHENQILVNGNEALALGALAAGCKFISAYPMTPASSIVEYMASKSAQTGLVMVQAEDEIAAINMALGASFAGVRAMTATSGGGFSLMVEALGLSGITETPLVIMEAQRGGPSTGLPTRTEQSDLEFVIHASHGEFPRIVLAPGNAQEAFVMGGEAFNLAEKYQLPVFVLTDQYLATDYFATTKFEPAAIPIDRGILWNSTDADPKEYKRYRFTESGISPRAFPGLSEALIMTTGDEHDEAGHITEHSQLRTDMMVKRLRKLDAFTYKDFPPTVYGDDVSDVTLIGWGSMWGAMREAVDLLAQQGTKAKMIHFSLLWPFPQREAEQLLSHTHTLVAVEQNATAQFAHLLRAETGIQVDRTILRFDGRPISPDYIVQHIQDGS